MPDELDLDDPLFARVRLARPAPPPSLAAAVIARLPIHRRTPALALGLVVAVASCAVAVLMLPAGDTVGSRRAIGAGPPTQVIDAGPLVDAAPPVSVETRVRAWILALREGELDDAAAMTSTPLVHLRVWGEAKHPDAVASNAKAVREVLARLSGAYPFHRAEWRAAADLGIRLLAGADLDAALQGMPRPLATSFGTLAKTDTVVRVDIRARTGDAAYMVAVASTPLGPRIEGVVELYIMSD